MIKISILGDIMCEPLLLKAAKKGGSYDFSGVFENVKELLSESDYVIGNLETPLAGKEAKYVNELYFLMRRMSLLKRLRRLELILCLPQTIIAWTAGSTA